MEESYFSRVKRGQTPKWSIRHSFSFPSLWVKGLSHHALFIIIYDLHYEE